MVSVRPEDSLQNVVVVVVVVVAVVRGGNEGERLTRAARALDFPAGHSGSRQRGASRPSSDHQVVSSHHATGLTARSLRLF